MAVTRIANLVDRSGSANHAHVNPPSPSWASRSWTRSVPITRMRVYEPHATVADFWWGILWTPDVSTSEPEDAKRTPPDSKSDVGKMRHGSGIARPDPIEPIPSTQVRRHEATNVTASCYSSFSPHRRRWPPTAAICEVIFAGNTLPVSSENVETEEIWAPKVGASSLVTFAENATRGSPGEDRLGQEARTADRSYLPSHRPVVSRKSRRASCGATAPLSTSRCSRKRSRVSISSPPFSARIAMSSSAPSSSNGLSSGSRSRK